MITEKFIDYSDTIIFSSPTYGDYIMTKICIVNMLDSLRNKTFVDEYCEYEILLDNIKGHKTKCLEYEIRMNQKISNFIYYAPIDKNNDKKLPVAYSEKYINKILSKI